MDLYNVIFEGKLLPGKNINAVKEAFGQLFKISSLQKVNEFFTGHPVVLKKAVSLEQAEKYEHALLKVGAYCRHELIVEEKEEVVAIDFEFSSTKEEPVEEAPKQEELEPEQSVADQDDSFGAIEFSMASPEPEDAAQADSFVEEAAADEFAPEQVSSVGDLSDLGLVPIEDEEEGKKKDD